MVCLMYAPRSGSALQHNVDRRLLRLPFQELLDDIYSNLSTALRPFLMIPVTAAWSKHSFGKLKLIKNYLQPAMGERRLSDLALPSIECKVAPQVDYREVITAVASVKVCRGHHFHSYFLFSSCFFLALCLSSLNSYWSSWYPGHVAKRDTMHCFQPVMLCCIASQSQVWHLWHTD